MGPALNIASSTNAYALTDRGTWLNFKNRGELVVLVEGDTRLFNQYGVIVVNAAKHPHTKTELAQAFADWVISADGQAVIAAYRIGGEQLFFPNANAKPGASRGRDAGPKQHNCPRFAGRCPCEGVATRHRSDGLISIQVPARIAMNAMS